MTYRTDFEKSNYIVKELGSGTYGVVYASIPKNLADQVIPELKDSIDPSKFLRQRASYAPLSKLLRSPQAV